MGTLQLASKLGAGLACGLVLGCSAAAHRPSPTASTGSKRPALDTPRRTQVLLGRSVEGRPIRGLQAGGTPTDPVVLVIGCIHGNESAGVAVVRRLQALPAPPGVELFSVPNLNPDGTHAGTRQNADGVDLNRNFPFRWQSIGMRGDQQYSGPHALSEPESRIAYRLISRLRPRVTIWFHQPLGVVDESGGSLQIERRFAQRAMLPLRRLARYPGSAAGWQNHALAGTTAFVVELPAGALAAVQANRLAAAVVDLALRVANSP
ncbi:MAG TPA: M14 family zinc carboxypeptidase [Solirubrobacteraceae bacterium]